MDCQQNKLAFITGASRGIGQSLCESLINTGFRVVGLSRTKPSFLHNNFQWIEIDLSDPKVYMNFVFENTHVDEVVLINNAGILGQILPIGELDSAEIRKVIEVNLISVMHLTELFYQTFKGRIKKAHVITISSGAGKRAIDAWSTYCISKAGVDMFMQCFNVELMNRSIENWHVHAIAPGVVDTAMQLQIRSANPEKFLAHERFVQLKENDELLSATYVSEKITKVILAPENYSSVLLSMQEIMD